jgi:uncharacterized protein YbbC (DUF1343 family)
MRNLFLFIFLFSSTQLVAQTSKATVKPGAENTAAYLERLKGKRVAVFANQTSVAGSMHLVDLLQQKGVQVKVIFGPEHGFRGTADAGEKVGNYVDTKTGIPVVSLYGAKRQPSAGDLAEVDILLFDIQDVGVRFYTFISSLEEYMEAAFLNNKPVIVFDRPNPNIHYVDGPVLDTAFRSFVGMQPVPVVYGMSIGEYARMLVGERWLKSAALKQYDAMKASGTEALQVVPCMNYTRKTKFELPVKPSPNLPDNASIYWYPSTCFFEGTVLSEGRGTPKPFQYFGHPQLPLSLFSFTPRAIPGAMTPKLKDQLCYGWDISGSSEVVFANVNGRLHLSYLLEAYRLFPEKDKFFIIPKSGDSRASFFNKLAGNALLMEQVKNGISEQDIRKSWQSGLDGFKKIRAKYLIYPEGQVL